MNTFIRLSDNLEMTEQDVDPLCTIPNINFKPNEAEYVKVRQWAKPSFDAIRQEVVKAPTALVGGIWTQQWAIIALSAEQIATNIANTKRSQWLAIKAKRDSLSDTGGYLVGTKWFHSDGKSKTQQLGLVLMGASVPAGLQWKTLDGTFVTMTQTLAGQVFAAAAAQDMALFAVAEQHNAAMEASATPDTYDFSGGWPATFGG